jgi:hypothetical protein
MKAQNLFATEEEEANSPKVQKSKSRKVQESKSSSARLKQIAAFARGSFAMTAIREELIIGCNNVGKKG